jgi:hypothetical protein
MKVGKCHMDKNHRKHQTAEIVRIDNGCNLNDQYFKCDIFMSFIVEHSNTTVGINNL